MLSGDAASHTSEGVSAGTAGSLTAAAAGTRALTSRSQRVATASNPPLKRKASWQTGEQTSRLRTTLSS